MLRVRQKKHIKHGEDRADRTLQKQIGNQVIWEEASVFNSPISVPLAAPRGFSIGFSPRCVSQTSLWSPAGRDGARPLAV